MLHPSNTSSFNQPTNIYVTDEDICLIQYFIQEALRINFAESKKTMDFKKER